MSAVLDDMDSRPGSTTSLLRTAVGLYLRQFGGWLSSPGLVAMMEAVDVPASLTRTALTRLRKKEVLRREVRDGLSGYSIGDHASLMLERGDRRIYHPRSMAPDDPWCLVSFTVPESDRQLRHQLRRRLHWIGCGTVAAGLWICPDYLRAEVEEILVDLELRSTAVVFVTGAPLVEGALRDATAKWWDLVGLAALHHQFIEVSTRLTGELTARGKRPPVSAATFSAYVRAMDQWRIIPYLDPGLPADCLPLDWPGGISTAHFERLRREYSQPAQEFAKALLAPP